MKTTYPATLLSDFYKLSHRQQYPKGTEYVYSTFTPRSNKHLPNVEEVVVFGIQGFIKEYLINYFNEHFFNRKVEDVVSEYKRFVKYTLGQDNADTKHIEELHELGYLPIYISAIKEGTRVPMKTPVLTINNTDSRFFWLTNYLETLMSSEIWHSMTTASVAHKYREILDNYAMETTGNTDEVDFQLHDFSLRGMGNLSMGAKSGAGHLLSFTGTDNVPSILYHEEFYNANIETEPVGFSIPACYDDKTEILTENGWKLFEELNNGEKVAQYHEDGKITFVVPSNYYNMPYKGKMVGFKSKNGRKYVDMLVTPNHRMVKRRTKDNSLQMFEADSDKYHERKGYSSKSKVVVSGKAIDGLGMSSLEKIKVAFQADGSYMNRKESYNGNRSGTVPIRFSLKKERKKNRLVDLLEDAGLEYTVKKYDNGYYSFYIKTDGDFVKDFSWIDLSNVTINWANDFIEELSYWDAHKHTKNTITYSSINKFNTDIVQALSSISGNKCTISVYKDKRKDYNRNKIFCANILLNKETIGGANVEKYYVDYDSTVHCVSVPTKMLIVRRNDVVAVSGNTEHSVMCANTPADGDRDEFDTYKNLITNIYPKSLVSIVSDSYDFWKVVSDVLPRLKNDIMNRDGKVVIRPDSGDPTEILCGKIYEDITNYNWLKENEIEVFMVRYVLEEIRAKTPHGEYGGDKEMLFKYKNKYYKMHVKPFWNRHDKGYYYIDGIIDYKVEEIQLTFEDKGLIESLWEIFGGTVSEQGYKVLDSHIGAIYGDSITLERAEEICKRLKEKGFASTNVVFGVGSYTYQYLTRDSFGFAMKATYAVIDGDEVLLYKDPKTDTGKRSQRGLVAVYRDKDGSIKYKDGLNGANQIKFLKENDDLLECVFRNGELVRDQSLKEIKEILKNQ